MKKFNLPVLFSLVLLFSACKNEAGEERISENEVVENSLTTTLDTNKEPWSEEQLMEPQELVQVLNSSRELPVIYSLGAGGIIPGSIDTGASGEKKGLNRLKEELENLPKDTEIILYCGCCPFDNCPNVRPAFSLLNEMNFSNHRLLNLRQNIKVDWIDKGFPVGS